MGTKRVGWARIRSLINENLDGPGQGLLLKIKSHPAAAGAATCAFTMYDPLYTTALTTSSKIDLITAPYNDIVIAPTTFGGTYYWCNPDTIYCGLLWMAADRWSCFGSLR